MVEEHIAGDPMNEEIRWVKLSRSEIREKLAALGIGVRQCSCRIFWFFFKPPSSTGLALAQG